MTAPTLVFAVLVATAVGALYHLLLGTNLRQLALFCGVSILGFALGQAIGSAMPPAIPHVGQLRLVEGTVLAVALMTVVRYLRL